MIRVKGERERVLCRRKKWGRVEVVTAVMIVLLVSSYNQPGSLTGRWRN